MRRSCNFQPNPALFAGAALLWISVFIRNVLELGGPAATAAHFLRNSRMRARFKFEIASSKLILCRPSQQKKPDWLSLFKDFSVLPLIFMVR